MLRFFWSMVRFWLRSKSRPPPGDAGQRGSQAEKDAGPAWGWRPVVCTVLGCSLCLLFLLPGRLDGFPDLRGGPAGGLLVGVRVNGQGGCYGGVAQALGDGGHVRPALYGDAGEGVAQLVGVKVLQPVAPAHLPEMVGNA